jgi:hypothetical protein
MIPFLKDAGLDERPGPARTLAPGAADALITRALDRALDGGLASRLSRPRRGVPRWLVALAVCALAGAAAASIYHFRHLATPAPAPEQPAPVERASAPSVVPAPAPPDAPIEPKAAEPIANPPHARPASPRAVQDLLLRANQQRAAHDWRGAERTYERILRLEPHSPDATVAAVGAADLRLTHLGDARGALSLFQRASRDARGTLAEEAQHGLAESYRALGNEAQERRTLEAFLRVHPSSVMRAQVEARLHSLSER